MHDISYHIQLYGGRVFKFCYSFDALHNYMLVVHLLVQMERYVVDHIFKLYINMLQITKQKLQFG